MDGPAGAASGAREPMYEDSHKSCSVLRGRIRNADRLLQLPPHEQFRWLHRFYLLLDGLAEQHKVYKLYGGPHGFLISAGVAEPDERHAPTLLRFALRLHAAAQQVRLPDQAPLDLCLALASSEASSGLLGSLSLTYQIVGRCMTEVDMLLSTQDRIPLAIARSLVDELAPEVVQSLVKVGRLPPSRAGQQCEYEQEVEVYTLPRYAHLAAGSPPLPATP